MIIDIKFDVGDELWYISDQHVAQKAYVIKICGGFYYDKFTNTLDCKILVNHYNDGFNFCEKEVQLSRCFKTKEELIKSL